MIGLAIHRRIFTALALSILLGACVPEANPSKRDDAPVILRAEFVGPWIEVLLGSTSEAFVLQEDGTVSSENTNFSHISRWRSPDEKLYLTISHMVNGVIETKEIGFPISCLDDYGCRIEMGGAPIWHYSG